MNLKQMTVGQTIKAKDVEVEVDVRAELTELNARVVDTIDDLQKLFPKANTGINKLLNEGHQKLSMAIDEITKIHKLDPETESVKNTLYSDLDVGTNMDVQFAPPSVVLIIFP